MRASEQAAGATEVAAKAAAAAVGTAAAMRAAGVRRGRGEGAWRLVAGGKGGVAKSPSLRALTGAATACEGEAACRGWRWGGRRTAACSATAAKLRDERAYS